uniref:WSC domain-containing protein n=1 Tax=Macrostomum lignano TaxID=282301 RepID=A0A1I8HES1_9PLAT
MRALPPAANLKAGLLHGAAESPGVVPQPLRPIGLTARQQVEHPDSRADHRRRQRIAEQVGPRALAEQADHGRRAAGHSAHLLEAAVLLGAARPRAPRKPVEWHSSTKVTALNSLARAAISASLATSPSMLNTPSVATRRVVQSRDSSSRRRRWPMSLKKHKSEYKGCYVDKADKHDLKYHAHSSNEMTLKMCNDLCKEVGAKFYGAQGGTECFCDDTFGSYGKQVDDYCDRACMGFLSESKITSALTKSEFCGGDKMNSVYEVLRDSAASAVANEVSSQSRRRPHRRRAAAAVRLLLIAPRFVHCEGRQATAAGADRGWGCAAGTADCPREP